VVNVPIGPLGDVIRCPIPRIQRRPLVRVLVINHVDAGFAGPVEMPEEARLAELLEQQNVPEDLREVVIRVNLRRASGSEVLREGDRITITPLR
jgi:sulfur carrier protein ThiS